MVWTFRLSGWRALLFIGAWFAVICSVAWWAIYQAGAPAFLALIAGAAFERLSRALQQKGGGT